MIGERYCLYIANLLPLCSPDPTNRIESASAVFATKKVLTFFTTLRNISYPSNSGKGALFISLRNKATRAGSNKSADCSTIKSFTAAISQAGR